MLSTVQLLLPLCVHTVGEHDIKVIVHRDTTDHGSGYLVS